MLVLTLGCKNQTSQTLGDEKPKTFETFLITFDELGANHPSELIVEGISSSGPCSYRQSAPLNSELALRDQKYIVKSEEISGCEGFRVIAGSASLAVLKESLNSRQSFQLGAASEIVKGQVMKLNLTKLGKAEEYKIKFSLFSNERDDFLTTMHKLHVESGLGIADRYHEPTGKGKGVIDPLFARVSAQPLQGDTSRLGFRIDHLLFRKGEDENLVEKVSYEFFTTVPKFYAGRNLSVHDWENEPEFPIVIGVIGAEFGGVIQRTVQ